MLTLNALESRIFCHLYVIEVALYLTEFSVVRQNQLDGKYFSSSASLKIVHCSSPRCIVLLRVIRARDVIKNYT